MDHVDAALDEGDAVVARIDVKEIGRERARPVIAELNSSTPDKNFITSAMRFEMHHHGGPCRAAGAESRKMFAAGL